MYAIIKSSISFFLNLYKLSNSACLVTATGRVHRARKVIWLLALALVIIHLCNETLDCLIDTITYPIIVQQCADQPFCTSLNKNVTISWNKIGTESYVELKKKDRDRKNEKKISRSVNSRFFQTLILIGMLILYSVVSYKEHKNLSPMQYGTETFMNFKFKR